MLHHPFTTSHGHTRHRGMTFTEVMFAVIILGIGFIMLAAIFPVAIQQTRTSVEQTQGAAMSRGALRYMEEVGTLTDATGQSLLVSTGNVVVAITNDPALPATLPIWKAISGNLIRADDDRYAWVPLYRRDTGSPFAQVFLFGVQVRGRDRFTPADDIIPAPANLSARKATVDLAYDTANQVSTINFTAGGEPIGEGAYVVTADGRIFRVGALVSGTKWLLAPGYEIKSDGSENVSGLNAFVVGRGLRNPAAAYNAGTNPYVNIVQDVGCYTTFVRVN